MKRRGKIIKDKKLRGEWAESVFVVCANEHGIPINKPWGEMNTFDFVVGKTRRFVSVQVKSTTEKLKTGYVCTIRSGHKAYPLGSFDFVAAYVIPEDVWYIIPAHLIQGKECITLYPNSKKAKYEPYREAWHLLRNAVGSEEEVAETVVVEATIPLEAPPSVPAQNLPTNVATGATQPPAPAPPSAPHFPRNAFERMQAAADFCRRAMEGRYPAKAGSDRESG